MMLSANPELYRLVALRVVERNRLRLKWHAATRFELALCRHDRALKYAYKTFDPNQPRVPGGSREGGQWASDSGQAGGQKPARSAERVRLAGNIHGFIKHGLNQAINRAISPSAILDAVVNPIQIIPQENGTTRYVGAGAVVVLNPAGRVVTVWGR